MRDSGAREPGSYHAYLRQRYFGSLNGLRCLCILLVLWHHSPANGLVQDIRLLERGFVGVDFFFVLSGYLITTLLLREEQRDGTISIPAFYWRRALRILPVYFLLVTAMSIYWIIVKGQTELAGMVPYYYLFLANFLKDDIPLLSITWSLSVEEQYYLVWPALLLVLPAVAWLRLWGLVGLILTCLLLLLGLADWLGLPRIETAHAVFVLPAMSYMAILWGSLMAVLLNDRRGYRVLAWICGRRWSPLPLFVLLLAFLHLAPENLASWPALPMGGLMALCLASLVMREDHVLRPVMSFGPVRRAGEISYGIYLYHLIGLHVANQIIGRAGLDAGPGSWLVTLTYPLITVLIAEISFRTYERYFLSLKSLRPRRRRRTGRAS